MRQSAAAWPALGAARLAKSLVNCALLVNGALLVVSRGCSNLSHHTRAAAVFFPKVRSVAMRAVSYSYIGDEPPPQ